jgi:DNA-dependent RNA polymerase auxiliary subunit epsilon
MAKRKHLSKKQLAVIDDLFAGELDEQAVLDKYGVSRNVYNKWLTDEKFQAEFVRRISGAHLASEALIARYSLVAAAKLVQLTDSENQETARKACLDIISLPKVAAKKAEQMGKEQKNDEKQTEQLSAETANRILAALAGEQKPE